MNPQKLQGMINELQDQRSWALTRCAELSGRVRELQVQWDAAQKELAELRKAVAVEADEAA